MIYLLDTDTLTHAHLGQSKVVDRIQNVGEENVATTIINAIEIIRGRHEYVLKAADGAHLLRAQQLLDESEKMLMDILIFPIDAQTAAEFDRARQIKNSRRLHAPICLSLA